MEALINDIVSKTGLSRDVASQGIRLTADYIKERVPVDDKSQIDGVFAGGSIGETFGRIVGEIEKTFRGQ